MIQSAINYFFNFFGLIIDLIFMIQNIDPLRILTLEIKKLTIKIIDTTGL